MYRFLLLFSFGLTAFFCAGQSAFSFTHYAMSDGLASNEIISLTQDAKGYIWIGSNNGLQRYDGIHFKTFKHRQHDSLSLPVNLIRQLLFDKQQRLWVCQDIGVGIFDQQNFTFHPAAIRYQNPQAITQERRLITDDDGNIFLLFRGIELLQYNAAKNEFSSTSTLPLLPNGHIATMSHQPGTGKYWLGLQEGGVVIYNRQTRHINYLGHNPDKEPAIEKIGTRLIGNSMFDSKGRFWFDHWNSIFPYAMYFDTRHPADSLFRCEFISTLNTYNETWGFMEQQDGRIWIRGLQLFGWFDENKKQFQLIPKNPENSHGMTYETVNCFFEDREKNVWTGTSNNALYRFNPSRNYFTNVHFTNAANGQPSNANINCFLQTKDNNIFVGRWGDGPVMLNPQLKSIPLPFAFPKDNQTPSIWDACISSDKNIIWMASQPGLFVYNQEKATLIYRNPPTLKNRTIRQVAEDKNGNLWLGTHGKGVFKWINPKAENQNSIIQLPQLTTSIVNKVFVDHQNWLWVGTWDKGLLVYNAGTNQLLSQWNSSSANGKMFGNYVSSIIEYNDSLMLIGTTNNLFLYHRSSHLLKLVQLSEDLIGGIGFLQKDHGGFVWIGTTNALYRYDLQKNRLLFFNRQDGIDNDRFETDAAYITKNGQLLAGTSNTIISFQPSAIRIASQTPSVVFTEIKTSKHSLPTDSIRKLDELTLSYQENALTVEFSPMSFIDEYQVQYKMEGIDDNWKLAEKDNRASFPFLPSGHYTLQLRTINAEGLPATQATALRMYVQPPFYRTWWFYLLIAAAFGVELYWLDRQRNLRKKSLQKVRTDISDNLHKEVNEALNNIHILSEIARLKSEREPQKAREFLEQIHSKSHNMIVAMDDMLWSLDPENDSMLKTINRLREFIDALMQQYNADIQLQVDKPVEKLSLNMKLRHDAFLLFRESLRSVMEAGTHQCDVHLACEKNKLLFTVEFDRHNCDIQQLTNLLNRRDINQRLNGLRAKLDIETHTFRSLILLQMHT